MHGDARSQIRLRLELRCCPDLLRKTKIESEAFDERLGKARSSARWRKSRIDAATRPMQSSASKVRRARGGGPETPWARFDIVGYSRMKDSPVPTSAEGSDLDCNSASGLSSKSSISACRPHLRRTCRRAAARRGGRRPNECASDATRCTRPRRKNSSQAVSASIPKSPRRLPAVICATAPRETSSSRMSGEPGERRMPLGMRDHRESHREATARGRSAPAPAGTAPDGNSIKQVLRPVQTGQGAALPLLQQLHGVRGKVVLAPGEHRWRSPRAER